MNPIFFDVNIIWWCIKLAVFAFLVAASFMLAHFRFNKNVDTGVILSLVLGFIFSAVAVAGYATGSDDANTATKLISKLHEGGVITHIERDSNNLSNLELTIAFPSPLSIEGKAIKVPETKIDLTEDLLRKISQRGIGFPAAETKALSSTLQ